MMFPGSFKRHPQPAEEQDEWLHDVGAVDLIGGWAEINFDRDFAAAVDTLNYHVFATSYDAVPVFIANRRSTGFEIHTLSTHRKARPSNTRCSYLVIARRKAVSHERLDGRP
jgi:hypothetical protein